MKRLPPSSENKVERYLRSGEYDDSYRAWSGANFLECARHGNAALREALISTVRRRTAHATVPKALAELDVAAFARKTVAPMVRGLFPQSEQGTVLDVLAGSIVFLTPTNIDTVLTETQWLGTAWDLANLYLGSFNGELLSDDAPQIVGLSEATTCYVSVAYFREESRFDDFVVHEAAHIFHNCKRETIGLREIRGREWLLDIDFAKRETFAYACEVYSRIIEFGNGPGGRQTLLSQFVQGPMPAPGEVDAGEYVDILGEAVAARNGWKRILERCSARRSKG